MGLGGQVSDASVCLSVPSGCPRKTRRSVSGVNDHRLLPIGKGPVI